MLVSSVASSARPWLLARKSRRLAGVDVLGDREGTSGRSLSLYLAGGLEGNSYTSSLIKAGSLNTSGSWVSCSEGCSYCSWESSSVLFAGCLWVDGL